MFKKISFILLLSVLFSGVYAQHSLKGYVQGEKGEPLYGANVFFPDIQKGVVTNFDGSFEIKGLKAGKRTLKVSYLGYKTKEIEVDVSSKSVLYVSLKKSDILSGEVIVKATRADSKTPFAFTDISAEEIQSRNTGEDITYLLNLEPSVVTTSETGTGFGYTAMRIRGSDATRINITVNGIPLNDSESQGVYWVNMPDFANSVSNIQIQRGVGTSTNGSGAFGASVNFKTENFHTKAFAEIDGTFGSFNTFKTSAKAGSGLINDRFAFDIRLSKMTTDGFIRNAFADHKSFAVNAAYITEKSLLKASIISGNQRTGITWWGNPDVAENGREYNPAGEYTDYFGQTRYYDDQTDNYIQTHYQLHYSHEFNSNLNFSVAGHYTRGDGFYEQYKPAYGAWSSNDFEDYGLNGIKLGDSLVFIGNKQYVFPDSTIKSTDMIRRKMMANDFYGGVFSLNYSNEKLNFSFGTAWNKYDGDHFGNILWTQWGGDYAKDYEWYFNNGTKTEFNAFAKANYAVLQNLNLYADIQYRNISYLMEGNDDDLRVLDQTHDFNFVNPKAGLFFTPNQYQTVYASFAMANREPTRANFKDAQGDEEAMPSAETLYDYEAGYSYTGKAFGVKVNFYYMSYKDQLVPTGEKSSVGYDIMTNVEKSFRRGIEISTVVKPIDFISWNASLTLSQNKIENFVEYANYYDENWSWLYFKAKELGETDIAYSPNVIASSQLSFIPAKGLTISLISKYVGEQYFDNTSNEERKIEAYFVNNALVTYDFTTKLVKNISLKLQVNNLLNAEYESNAYGGFDYVNGEYANWSYYFPQAGINFLAGASFRF